MRVVLDTNQHISAVIVPQGNPARLFQKWREGVFELVLSPSILAEIKKVLLRPRILDKYSLTKREIDGVVEALYRYAVIVAPHRRVNAIKDDPKDNMVLECAIAGRAGCVVSGDHHLLDLCQYKGIKILTAVQFLKFLEEIKK